LALHTSALLCQNYLFYLSILEFWEDHFKCRYPGGLSTPHNQGYHRACTGEERLTKENTQFEAQLQFVSDAVMAFAHAFRLLLSHFIKEILELQKNLSNENVSFNIQLQFFKFKSKILSNFPELEMVCI
jgi:hypothetical protein